MTDEIRSSDQVFRVGDVVEFLPGSASPDAARVIGMEGVIVQLNTGPLCLYHEVRASDGDMILSRPHALRKKRPPRDDLQVVRWDTCPWQPEKVHG